MPVYEPPRGKTSVWVYIVGGCLALGLLVLLGFGALGFFMARTIHQAVTAPPPPISSYTFPYSDTAASCAVTLPDGEGQLIYMHVLPTSTVPTAGQRALRLVGAKGAVDRPLQYYCASAPRIGIYWYPRTTSSGPQVRLLDTCGETIVDVDRRVSRMVIRRDGSVFVGDMAVDSSSSSEEISGDPPKLVSVEINGKPANDMTALFGKDQGTYLGTIVRRGNALVLVNAGTPQADKPRQGRTE